MNQWAKDLQSLVDSVPFGDITPTITKAANHVTKMTIASAETIRYDDTQQALDDVGRLIDNMHNVNYDGEIVFKLIMKGGEIQRIAYYNERTTNYNELKQTNGKPKKQAANTQK